MALVEVRVPIEIDVTYVNKAWFTMKKPVRINHYVIGFCQRGIGNVPPRVVIKVLEDNSPKEIKRICLKYVQESAFVYCEENVLPQIVKELFDVHEFKINDVNKEVHVSNVKNAWKDLKRNLKTVHISVSKKYLQAYCDEVSWKINNAHLSHEERFNLLIKGAIENGKTTQQDFVK